MTVAVTDPDFNFSELDWKSFRYKRYTADLTVFLTKRLIDHES